MQTVIFYGLIAVLLFITMINTTYAMQNIALNGTVVTFSRRGIFGGKSKCKISGQTCSNTGQDKCCANLRCTFNAGKNKPISDRFKKRGKCTRFGGI
ncbi:hypothetical protein I4U23_023108 [Adineta vaga]|nr:hypothetical protein I4U23_023108 [Adineta vaga]